MKLYCNYLIRLDIVRFLCVGVMSTIINYIIFYMLLQQLYVNYMLSSAIGFVSGILFGYILNKSWTYRTKKSNSEVFTKYICVYLFSLFLGLCCLRFLVYWGVDCLIANTLIIIMTTCTNFIGTKFWVFKI